MSGCTPVTSQVWVEEAHERRWDREMFAFLVMSFKEHNTRAKAVRQHGSTSVELGILPAMCDVIMKHVP